MLSKVIDGIDIIIGKDVISRLGGVMIRDGSGIWEHASMSGGKKESFKDYGRGGCAGERGYGRANGS